jgi:hypothetical protein
MAQSTGKAMSFLLSCDVRPDTTKDLEKDYQADDPIRRKVDETRNSIWCPHFGHSP